MADPLRRAAGALRGAARAGRTAIFARRLRPGSVIALPVAAAVTLTIFWPPQPLLLWNPSPSSPVGLYAVTAPDRFGVGDFAVAWAPPAARRLAAVRSYLPIHVPLVKRVAAAAGDRVCARATRILINGRLAALRRRRDPSGRPMPWWTGCARLGPGQILLLSAAGPLAFDGRYFGPTGARQVIGKARLLWPGS